MDPAAIVEKMMSKDAFSRWLGIEVISVSAGSCKLRMQVKEEMLNGFSIAHGGITFSFADSALAFASNAGGSQAVSVQTSISHIKSLCSGDVIVAEARQLSETSKFGHYEVTVKRAEQVVAIFHGTVFRTGKVWD